MQDRQSSTKPCPQFYAFHDNQLPIHQLDTNCLLKFSSDMYFLTLLMRGSQIVILLGVSMYKVLWPLLMSSACGHNLFLLFLFMQWLPYSLKWQWMYVLYRWIVMVYFLAWLIVTVVQTGQFSSQGAKYLIYLTNWGFIMLNAYFLVAAVSVLLSCILQRHYPVSSAVPTLTDTREERRLSCSQPLLAFVNGLHWVLGVIGGEFAVGVTILFWTFFNDPSLFSYSLSAESLHVHMLNGIVALLDIWVTGLPFRILHVIYSMIFASSYVVFTGIYYAANGTDISGNRYIYPVLDYENNTGLAAGVAVSCAMLLSIALHTGFFLMYICRYWFSRLVQTRAYAARVFRGCLSQSNAPSEVHLSKDEETV